MNKSTKIVLGLGAVAILIGGIQDVMNLKTSGLRQAHQAAWPEHSTTCEHLNDSGNTWAVCDYGRGTPSAWLKVGDDWATANGKAQQVLGRLEERGPGAYQDLPRLYIARGMAISMPEAVLERLQ